jgi:hypothetical protein
MNTAARSRRSWIMRAIIGVAQRVALAGHASPVSRGRPEGEPGLDNPLGLPHGVRERRARDVRARDGPRVAMHNDVPCTVELDRDDAMAKMEPAHGPHAFAAASHGGQCASGGNVARPGVTDR